MQETITTSILIVGVALAALAATVGMAGAVQLTSRRSHGYLHLIFYGMVLLIALGNLLSGRDLASTLTLATTAAPARHPLMSLVQPLVSLLLLTVAGERIITHCLKRDPSQRVPVLLLMSFVVFWVGTIAMPALFGAHPQLSHDYVYPLVIGIAAVLATSEERDLALDAARNALLLLMAASLLLIPFIPGLVIDTAYTQGFLPGVPRLAGLAAHAVSLGMLAQLGLLCLLARPYRRVWLTRLAWSVGLLVLFLAQSKTAWISFALCFACMVAIRHGPGFWRRVSDPMRPEFGVVSILAFMGVVALMALVVMFGEVDARLARFFNSAEGAEITSLTGRDKIWVIAYDEWQRNPLFGYGPTLWDESFRASIGMPNATNAHNQFMDTLSRSGTTGAVALVIYAMVLLVLSLRYARVSGGLTLALFMALALRSMSEVPLQLLGYGAELLTHAMLLMSLAAAARGVRAPGAAPAFARTHPRFDRPGDSLINRTFSP